MTNTNLKINLNTLEVAVNEYFQAEEERQIFLKTWVGGWWESKTAKQREDYTKHDERVSGKWNTVITICRLIGIDCTALIVVIKAFNRFTRNGGKWDRYIGINRLTYWQEDNFLSLISKDSETLHYKSTGRKDKTVA